jgi:hypothetical protein
MFRHTSINNDALLCSPPSLYSCLEYREWLLGSVVLLLIYAFKAIA